MLKFIPFVFLFFFSLEVTGNASSHNKIHPIIDSHRLSEKIWVEIQNLVNSMQSVSFPKIWGRVIFHGMDES